MAYTDLRDFVRALEKQGELKRIPFEVSPELEITEFADRSVKSGGPALLFEKPAGSSVPVLINAFASMRRMEIALEVDSVDEIAGRIVEFDWHVVVYFEAADLPELWDFFTALPTTVVVDHMGRPDVSKPVDGPEFALFLKFMEDYENVWCKVTCPERLSVSGPPALNGERNAYRDVVPFARKVVEEFPDRVLWGTDWPHPNLKGHMPDDGLLVDFIPEIATAPDLQDLLLVDNPIRLYWPEERRR